MSEKNTTKKVAKKKSSRATGRPNGRPTKKQAILNRIDELPDYTPTHMRKIMQSCLVKHDLNPMEELIKVAKHPDTPMKTVLEINKFLMPYITPTLKAVDVQQETNMNVTVSVQSFKGASQDYLEGSHASARKPVNIGEYEEFLEVESDDSELLEGDE